MIAAGRLASGEAVAVRITEHAVMRYRERVKCHIDHAEAATELVALISLCPIREGTPHWLRSLQRSLFHLDAGTIMLAIDPDPTDSSRLIARTVLTTGCFPRESRRRGMRGRDVGSQRMRCIAG